jgi:hypothetical protein
MAAVAALTVATGLAATFGVGFGHGSSHAVLTRSQTGSAPSISSPARSSAGTSTTPSGAAGGAATRSGAGTLIPSASGTWAASSARSVPTPLRVQNPVPVVGAQADSNAQKAPVRTSVPGVVSIGAWPKTVTDYAQRTLYRAGTALNTVSGASSSTAP